MSPDRYQTDAEYWRVRAESAQARIGEYLQIIDAGAERFAALEAELREARAQLAERRAENAWATEEIERLRRTVSFLDSVIRSGEPYTQQVADAVSAALSATEPTA